jgi:hypothetical protein
VLTQIAEFARIRGDVNSCGTILAQSRSDRDAPRTL